MRDARLPSPPTHADCQQIAADFYQLTGANVTFDIQRAPHRRPTGLPRGQQAVYVFYTSTQCLKVGRAGPNSHARFAFQHYSLRAADSTLAKSILDAPLPPEPFVGATAEDIKSRILIHCTRYHFYLAADEPPSLLALLESFVQARLRPLFEGRD